MTSSPAIRIATFNIRNNRAIGDGRNFWWFRRTAALRAICGTDANLVGLQEVRWFPLQFLRRRFVDRFAVMSQGRTNGGWRGEHCTVLAQKERLGVQRWSTRWFSDTPDVPGSRFSGAPRPRMCAMVDVFDHVTQLPFTLVNAHLESFPVDVRARSIALLASWATHADRPWIIVGDFNCAVDAPEMAPLWDAGFRDGLASIPARGIACATHHGFSPGGCDGDRIDHVLIPASATAANAAILNDKVDGKYPSDHWPVVVDVSLTRV